MSVWKTLPLGLLAPHFSCLLHRGSKRQAIREQLLEIVVCDGKVDTSIPIMGAKVLLIGPRNQPMLAIKGVLAKEFAIIIEEGLNVDKPLKLGRFVNHKRGHIAFQKLQINCILSQFTGDVQQLFG